MIHHVDRQFHIDLCEALGEDPDRVSGMVTTQDSDGTEYVTMEYAPRQYNLADHPRFKQIAGHGE